MRKSQTQTLCIFIATLILAGCAGISPDGSPTDDNTPLPGNQGVEASNPGVTGKIQKGPFQIGANVILQELNDELVPTGVSYNLYTNNDFGQFELAADISSPTIEAIAQGYYFNEVTGEITDALLTLRSLSAPGDTININILTTLIEQRIRALVANGSDFEAARTQAQSELAALIGITDDIGDFDQLDLSGATDADAVLIAASAVFQGDNSVAELSALVTEFTLDFADGTLDDAELVEEIRANSRDLDLAGVRENLEGYYGTTTVPVFEDFVDGDGDGTINRDDDTCSYSAENAAYNQNITVLDSDDGDVSFDYTDNEHVFILSDYAGTITARDTTVFVTEDGADFAFGGSVRGTFILNGAQVEAAGEIDSAKVYVRAGTVLDVTEIDRSTVYVENGGTLIAGEINRSTVYVEDGGALTVATFERSSIKAYDGATVTQTGTTRSATIYAESGATVSAAATPVTTGEIGDFVSASHVFLEGTLFAEALDLDVTSAHCTHGYESAEASGTDGEAYFVEHGGTLTLSNATDAIVNVQSGASLVIDGGSGHVVYAQSAANVTVTGTASDVTVYYEAGSYDGDIIEENDSPAATVDLSGATGAGNAAVPVNAVLFY